MRQIIEQTAVGAAFAYAVVSLVMFIVWIVAHAAVDTTFPAQPGVVDPIARAEIDHLKDLINAADKRYEQRFNAQESAVGAALAALEKAGAAELAANKEASYKSATDLEKRLDSVNEFRGQLSDQASTFVTRTELYGSIMGIGGLAIGIVGLLLRKRAEDIGRLTGKRP